MEYPIIFRAILVLYRYITVIPFMVLAIVMFVNGMQPIPWHTVCIIITLIGFNLIYIGIYLEYTEDKTSFGVRFLSRFVKADVFILYSSIMLYISACNDIFITT